MKYFYFSWYGSKRRELKYLQIFFDKLNEYDTIVEPFCGSSCISFHIYNQDSKKVFYLNDIDERLIDFTKDIKKNGSKKYIDFCNENWTDDTTKTEYKEIIKVNDLKNWFYSQKIYNFKPGMYPQKKKFNLKHDDYKELDKFYKNKKTIISNDDYKKVFEKFKDDERALIFLDPPYYLSYNDIYKNNGLGFSCTDLNKTQYNDPTAEYIYIRNALNKYKCGIILIINNCALLEDYFRGYVHLVYDFTYLQTRKKNKHMIVTNIKI